MWRSAVGARLRTQPATACRLHNAGATAESRPPCGASGSWLASSLQQTRFLANRKPGDCSHAYNLSATSGLREPQYLRRGSGPRRAGVDSCWKRLHTLPGPHPSARFANLNTSGSGFKTSPSPPPSPATRTGITTYPASVAGPRLCAAFSAAIRRLS